MVKKYNYSVIIIIEINFNLILGVTYAPWI